MKTNLNQLHSVNGSLLTFNQAIDLLLDNQLALLDAELDRLESIAGADNDIYDINQRRDHIINLILVRDGKTEERKLSDGCFTIIKS